MNEESGGAKSERRYGGGPTPYGKSKDEREQKLMKLVRELREQGMTWTSIAELLNEDEEYRPRRAEKWTRMNLSKVARYAGIR